MRKKRMFLIAAAAIVLGAMPALADEAADRTDLSGAAAVLESRKAPKTVETEAKETETDTEEATEEAETDEGEPAETTETAEPREAKSAEAGEDTEAEETTETAVTTEAGETTGAAGTDEPTEPTESEEAESGELSETGEPAETDGQTEITESGNTETESEPGSEIETETDDTEAETQPEQTVLKETSPKAVKEGEVAYVISIPCTVDLGTLNQPESAGGAVTVQSVSVKAKTVEGLSKGEGIAVYVRDGASDGADFRLYGTDESNSGKSLSYSILIDGQPAGERSDPDGNGCLVATFHEAGETAALDLQFDQSQLPVENLSGWEGGYTGTLRFYSEQVGGNGND